MPITRFPLAGPVSFRRIGRDGFLQRARRAGAVTFDIFDTALLRRVHRPVEIFALVADAFARRRGRPLPVDLAALRAMAEDEARRDARHASGCGEVTLEAIHARLAALLDGRLDEADRALVLELELEAELRHIRPNPEVLAVHAACRAMGVRTAFITDMYLPERTLRAMLAEAGYGREDPLYVSALMGASKAEGTLYPPVAAALGVETSGILHLGDNLHSDVRQAARAGVRPVWYEPPERDRDGVDAAPCLGSSIARGLDRIDRCRRAAEPGGDIWDRIGYAVAGPMYVGFTLWLREELKRRPTDRVFFLARDGLILNSVYDRMQGLGAEAPPSSYLLASRRCFYFPAMRALDDAALDYLCSGSSRIPVADYFERFGLAPPDPAAVRAAGFADAAAIVHPGAGRERLRALFRADGERVIAAAADERAAIAAYLDSMGVPACERLAVVDIGWHGGLQAGIAGLLEDGRARTIDGYYLGIFTRRAPASAGAMHGYLFTDGEPAAAAALVRRGVEILEFFLAAQHGSMIRFRAGQRGVQPEMGPFDADDPYAAAARGVQQGALRFVGDWMEAVGDAPATLSRGEVLARLERLIDRPAPAEAAAIGGLHHQEGMGTVGGLAFIGRPPAFAEIVAAPRRLLRGYVTAPWQVGYLTNLLGNWRRAELARGVLEAARQRRLPILRREVRT